MESSALPWAWGGPVASAVLRSCAEDFQVEEELGFSPDGEGQHLLLRIRKRDTNTQWVARQIAHVAGVPSRAVGYAGLKDRHAETSQWFSVDLAGRSEPDWSALDSETLSVLEKVRHRKKLRRGTLKGNRFTLTLRQLYGDRASVEERLRQIREKGVPNYFGEQRFGHKGTNLQRALALFRGELRVRDRHLRGLYLSAARSLLFNRVLAVRVSKGCWQTALPGEALILAGSRSFFTLEEFSAEIRRRLSEGDLLPSGPLWGKGTLPSKDDARALEEGALQEFEIWLKGLESAGLKQERRALCLNPERFSWEWLSDEDVRLRFFLPAGGYATTVLRELVHSRT